jgi:hypothetical protein
LPKLARARKSTSKGKKKHQAGPKTLLCKGVETVDRGFGQNEISDNFATLYHDDSIQDGVVNPLVRDALVSQQTSRLRKIRARAAAENQHFEVPLWLVLECRARFASKSATAPGADSISWEFLSGWPINVIDALRAAFQARLCDTSDVKPKIAMWGRLLTKLIPKPSDVRHLKNWRPICLSSCLQK